ncbi:MAG: response regulator, partial [Oscillospiraceae bacterium]|nr:response regulator [Oscillospiraceae bacterium]
MTKGKILVVDDDQNICELLRLYIEKENFEVVIANDGRQALTLFDEQNPDLVLLDIMLPEMDGWEVL